MAQHDYVISNAPGVTIRGDVNDALAAIVTRNSGASEPSTTYAGMIWLDTTANLVKRRNAANNGWIVEGSLDESFFLGRSSNTILAGKDRGKTLNATASYTQTLTAAATLGDGWFIDIIVDSGATLTLDPNSTETVDGSATKAIVGPAQGRLVCNGTLFRTIGFGSASDWVLGTAVATTSGTTKDFTGLPPNIAEILFMFYGVSTGGASAYLLQIGDSGGMANTGYTSGSWQGGSGDVGATSTAGFLATPTAGAANTYRGSLRLTRFSGNKWVISGVIGRQDGTGFACGGSKELSGELTQLRFTTVSADTFDAGEVNILYRVA